MKSVIAGEYTAPPAPGPQILLHPETRAPVRHEPVELHERIRVEEKLDPLPGSEFPLRMLRLDPFLPAPLQRQGILFAQFVEHLLKRHAFPLLRQCAKR